MSLSSPGTQCTHKTDATRSPISFFFVCFYLSYLHKDVHLYELSQSWTCASRVKMKRPWWRRWEKSTTPAELIDRNVRTRGRAGRREKNDISCPNPAAAPTWWHNERVPFPFPSTSRAHLLSSPYICLILWPTFSCAACAPRCKCGPRCHFRGFSLNRVKTRVNIALSCASLVYRREKNVNECICMCV